MSKPKDHKLHAAIRSNFRAISWSPEDGLRAVDFGNEDVPVSLKEATEEMQRLAKAVEEL